MDVDRERRRILSIGVAGAISSLLANRPARSAQAEVYPARPVRILLGFPPGGTADLLTRIVAEWLQTRLGQPFLVENRPGAGTNLATEAVVRAPADGYTLLATTTSNLLNGALYPDMKYDFVRDIAPVASLSVQPLVIVAGNDGPVASLADLLARARANPGRLTVGNFGNGTIAHVAAIALERAARIDIVDVAYRGSPPMLTDLMGGRIEAGIDNLPAVVEHVRSGRLRALAVTTATRSDALPAVPTVAETLAGYEFMTVAGIAAPRGTPPERIARLNAEINAGLADAKFRERLVALGAMIRSGSPSDFAALIARETDKLGQLIRTAGIRLE
jgi:tripartite-type tricarboxylate transporter receptor subunit TctC